MNNKTIPILKEKKERKKIICRLLIKLRKNVLLCFNGGGVCGIWLPITIVLYIRWWFMASTLSRDKMKKWRLIH